MKKNELLINTYYNDKFVASEKFNGTRIIEGNGDYSFQFTDLAGNIYLINNNEKIYVDMFREVVVTLNNEAPVNNGYYNDEVVLTIFESSKYVTGSIEVYAERNGEQYNVSGYNPYVFSDFGSYRVTVKAKYPNVDEKLETTLNFIVVNKKEARKSINLNNVVTHKVLSVKNQDGVEIKNEFLEMMSLKKNDHNLTHEDVMLNADKLKITAGKQMFTIAYLVEDSIYPPREMVLSFTLNDEDPKIACSLERGDSTTKKFTITFNAAAIYEQIGDSYIYVNNVVVAHISSDSANGEQNITFSYKKDGDGDYYVRIESASGVVLDSFKVTIKEPLNAGAIIVIIVIVGVVGAVVVSVVLLRRRMRIR